MFHWAQDLEPVAVQQILKFNPAPKLEHPDKEWHQIEERELPAQWLDLPSNPTSQSLGALSHRIERYVLQNFVAKPLQDPSKPWIWRKGSLAYWGQVEIRSQQLAQRTGKDTSLQRLQRLGWHLADHWHSDSPVTLEGFTMLFNMLWSKREDDRIHVLLQYTAKIRALHQQMAFDHDAQAYKEWLNKASGKGCRGLFRSLKKDEMPYLRPFQDRPRVDRMALRTQQWGEIWGIRQNCNQNRYGSLSGR